MFFGEWWGFNSHVSPGSETITLRSGLMKYIPVFHPPKVALRSKSVPDGFVTKDFANAWNNRVYLRLSRILCGFEVHLRNRPSGEKCGLKTNLTAAIADY